MMISLHIPSISISLSSRHKKYQIYQKRETYQNVIRRISPYLFQIIAIKTKIKNKHIDGERFEGIRHDFARLWSELLNF